jgi:DMSO/TMAO reductase YedYZ molybdopterin-dependent catalytic subunit
MSPVFRTNGNTRPMTDAYAAHERRASTPGGSRSAASWPGPRLSLADLRSRPARTQITLHNWRRGLVGHRGVDRRPPRAILGRGGPAAEARFVVFRCADSFGARPYYESNRPPSAFHPQTILAYGMNGGTLAWPRRAAAPALSGAAAWLQARKYLTGVEPWPPATASATGKGGHWEDVGFYDWYAGI